MNEDSKKDNENKSELRCSVCQQNHKVTDCNEIKNKAYSEKVNLVKSKKVYFNCLSNTHTISHCKSKISCRAKGCEKRHHTLLHPLPVNKISAVPLQSSDSLARVNNELLKIISSYRLAVSQFKIKHKYFSK